MDHPKFIVLRPEFFYSLIYGNFFSDLGSGGRKKEKRKKALKVDWSFSELFFQSFFQYLQKKQ